MKIVKEFLNEKFEEDYDPIKTMGIGLLPRATLTAKQYDNLHTYNLMNTAFFRKYMFVGSPMEASKMQKLLKLTKNNKQFFLDTFGRQDFVYTFEYKHYVWAFKLPSDNIFLVLTGNKGTSFEYTGGLSLSEEDTKKIIQFLDYLTTQIKL